MFQKGAALNGESDLLDLNFHFAESLLDKLAYAMGLASCQDEVLRS